MSNRHNIVVDKTATYYTLGDINKATTIWFVLHGYGYLAEYFIKKFEPIVDENVCIVAPEGLSKFYLNGVTGRVGATWMTKIDRENEIKDYIGYLNQLYTKVKGDRENVKINIVGFSQGGATACRWVSDGKIDMDNFILWASVFPDDMNFNAIADVNTFFLYGNNDEWVTDERVSKQKEVFKSANINIEPIVFNGNHDIPKKILLEQTQTNNWN